MRSWKRRQRDRKTMSKQKWIRKLTRRLMVGKAAHQPGFVQRLLSSKHLNPIDWDADVAEFYASIRRRAAVVSRRR